MTAQPNFMANRIMPIQNMIGSTIHTEPIANNATNPNRQSIVSQKILPFVTISISSPFHL
jgi:hypothetical protein